MNHPVTHLAFWTSLTCRGLIPVEVEVHVNAVAHHLPSGTEVELGSVQHGTTCFSDDAVSLYAEELQEKARRQLANRAAAEAA